jgi:hypothetical protein
VDLVGATRSRAATRSTCCQPRGFPGRFTGGFSGAPAMGFLPRRSLPNTHHDGPNVVPRIVEVFWLFRKGSAAEEPDFDGVASMS